jgi:hypothetical protein
MIRGTQEIYYTSFMLNRSRISYKWWIESYIEEKLNMMISFHGIKFRK